MKATGLDFLHEVDVLVMGEGFVGFEPMAKTSAWERLIGEEGRDSPLGTRTDDADLDIMYTKDEGPGL